MPEITGLYTGPSSYDKYARNISKIESSFDGKLRFDDMLSEIAIMKVNGSDLSVVDVGSGSGTFLTSLTDETQVSSFLKQAQQKGLRVKATGFTDAPSSEKQNQPDANFTVQSAPENFDVANYYYTLTAAQTIAKFLDSHDIQSSDLFLASQSLMYVSAEIFKESVDEMIRRLNPHGKIVIWGVGFEQGPLPAYSGVDATHLRESNEESDAALLNLFIEDKITSIEMPKLTLRADWSSIKERVDRLIEKLGAKGQIDEEVDTVELKKLMGKYSMYKSKPEAGLDQVTDDEASIALQYFLQLHPYLVFMRDRQYAKQVQEKQDYLQSLRSKRDISVTVLRERRSSGIDALIIEKTLVADLTFPKRIS